MWPTRLQPYKQVLAVCENLASTTVMWVRTGLEICAPIADNQRLPTWDWRATLEGGVSSNRLPLVFLLTYPLGFRQ